MLKRIVRMQMGAISIRRASTADIPLIRSMADVVFPLTYADILSDAQMEYMMEWMYSRESLGHQINDEGKYFFIASEDGRPAGYVSFESDGLTPDGRNLYHLQKLYVLPECQKRGIGSFMLSFVKKTLSEANPGGCRMELNVNRSNPATLFYERSGLTRDRQGDFPIGKGFYMNDFIYAADL